MTSPAPYAPVAPYPRPVVARPLPADATGEGLAYHRLVFARRRSGWWTPLVTGLLGLAIYMAISIAFGVVAVLLSIFGGMTAFDPLLGMGGDLLDVTNPLLLLVVLGSIALMWPSFSIASLVVNGPRVGLLSSVAGRLRWGWLGKTFLLAVAAIVIVSGLAMLLPAEGAVGGDVVAPEDNPAFLASLLVILLIVPFQAAAEEYVFRGYLGQMVGRWLRHPAWAILLPVPLFTFGHLYDAIGLISVSVFAVGAGWVTWRTGGLEAAISLHIVNNLVAFGQSLFGFSDANATETDVWSLVSSVVMIGAYVAAVEVLFRRGDRRRTLRIVPAPAPAPWPAGAAPWPAPVYPGAAPVYPGAAPAFPGAAPAPQPSTPPADGPDQTATVSPSRIV